jgi:hypothetical protein
MLSTELENLCTEFERFLQGRNAFDKVGMLSTGLECFLQGWNTFVQVWNTFYRVGIPLYKVGMHSTELEYLCTRLECFLQGGNAF